MGAALGAYIDAMQQDGRLDADEAWLERQIAAKASSLKDGLERAKAAAKRLKQAFKAREKAASQHAPADALPPPPRVVVPDEVVEQYDEIEAEAAPLIKQYFRRAMASKPKLDHLDMEVKGKRYSMPRVTVTDAGGGGGAEQGVSCRRARPTWRST
jgi:hypothetical protein